jgi:hypothetical protein
MTDFYHTAQWEREITPTTDASCQAIRSSPMAASQTNAPGIDLWLRLDRPATQIDFGFGHQLK